MTKFNALLTGLDLFGIAFVFVFVERNKISHVHAPNAKEPFTAPMIALGS